MRVFTERHGILLIEQTPAILARIGCLTANGVMLCQPEKAFSVLVEKFSSQLRILNKGKTLRQLRIIPVQP